MPKEYRPPELLAISRIVCRQRFSSGKVRSKALRRDDRVATISQGEAVVGGEGRGGVSSAGTCSVFMRVCPPSRRVVRGGLWTGRLAPSNPIASRQPLVATDISNTAVYNTSCYTHDSLVTTVFTRMDANVSFGINCIVSSSFSL